GDDRPTDRGSHRPCAPVHGDLRVHDRLRARPAGGGVPAAEAAARRELVGAVGRQLPLRDVVRAHGARGDRRGAARTGGAPRGRLARRAPEPRRRLGREPRLLRRRVARGDRREHAVADGLGAARAARRRRPEERRGHVGGAGVYRHGLPRALLPSLSSLSALLPAHGTRAVPPARGGGRMSVGIERLAVYVPAYALKLEDLAAARGVAPEKYRDGLGLGEMALVPPCEDVVTLAATAGARLIGAAHLDPAQIGMLLVATETPVDHAKPVASFVHGLLGLSSHCRVWDLTHACYAGTAALMTAADWVRAGGHRVR